MADNDSIEGRVLRVVEQKRKDANLTQTTLAELTGIPLASLNRYLRGHGSLPFRHLESLADALGTTPAAITAEAEVA
jgi:transcriptional regulator with XRE-family HTH domain